VVRAATSPTGNFFDNYTKLPARLPRFVWHVARVLVLLSTVAIAALLAVRPAVGLKILWDVAVPILPLVLVVAPGFWRQVCPMAFLNQIPRMANITQGLDLPQPLKNSAFAIAVASFAGCVALRVPVLNQNAFVVAAGVLAALGLALTGGLVFKGRSGWCGTFCPLGPIQRTFGQAPLIIVRNGFCNTCVGCQKNCYDFNPRGAIFSDVYDDDPRFAWQRRLFMGLLPGLILGYFGQGPAPAYGEPQYHIILFGACCASAGLYGLAVSFLPVAPYKISVLFGAFALGAFYWFSGPTMVRAIADLLSFQPPALVLPIAQSVGIVGALALLGSGLYSEIQYKRALRASEAVVIDSRQKALRSWASRARGPEVTDRGTGITFDVPSGATLLEALEKTGLKINFGCRSGSCGADAVAVCEGEDHLSPPGEDELATLRRLGLEGHARLACMCRVAGPVLIDRDPKSRPGATVKRRPAATVDKGQLAGISRVVIIGNGVAGTSAAEALRRASQSVAIDVITNEPLQFYNRMAIGRLIYGRTSMDELQLLPDGWFAENRVDVRRNTVAASIDRSAKSVVLSTGEHLPYDRLILATGAHSALPTPDFLDRPNAFVLRSADDAHAIRHYIQVTGARRATVIGGGVLGVEAADALHHLGLQTTILQRADRLMNAQLDEPGAAKLTAFFEGLGVQVVPNASIVKFDADDPMVAWLAHGPRVRADVFIACLGIEANTYLAERSGLEVGRHIRVNDRFETSDPDIFAIGDVAQARHGMGGLWTVGAAQAAAAVAAMLGEARPPAPPRTILQLKCDGIDLRSFGNISDLVDAEIFTARPDAAAWWRLAVRHGAFISGIYVGPPGTATNFTRVLQSGADLAALRRELKDGNLAALAS
jgi:nitrite reductase (NADH) large subunit